MSKPPLIAGGQGRSARDVELDARYLFTIVAAGLILLCLIL